MCSQTYDALIADFKDSEKLKPRASADMLEKIQRRSIGCRRRRALLRADREKQDI